MMGKNRTFTAYQLKWIAIITMTVDHFGVIVLLPFTQTETISTLYLISRLIGRIAFPLFGFMIAEGMYRTKHPLKYLGRLWVMAVLIGVAMWFLEHINIQTLSGNIFIDLSMAASSMYFFKHKKLPFRILALLPITYVLVTSLLNPFPNYISADYGFYGLLMMLLFYISYQNLPGFILKLNPFYSQSIDVMPEQKRYQSASVIFIMMHILWYIMSVVLNEGLNLSGIFPNYLNRFIGAQTYAVFAAYFIYHYKGEKGNTPKWFQGFSYLYYPLHFILLFAVYYFINL